MNITLTPLKVFELRVDGKLAGEYSVASEWNGMVELRERFENNGGVAIVSRDQRNEILRGLLTPLKQEPEPVQLIKVRGGTLAMMLGDAAASENKTAP